MITRRVPNLSNAQARGEACAWCRAAFSAATPSVPVPGVESIYGVTVRACPPPRPCAGQLGHRPAVTP